MRKFKCLLMVSLIAILATGILAGCSIGGGIYIPPEVDHLVTYCGNGGMINNKVERYIYVQDDVHAFDPFGGTSVIEPVVRPAYRFVGWKVCKVDENGKPLLRDTAISSTDGGVYVTENGTGDAIAESDIPNYKDVVLKYYDYEDTEWVFTRDRVTKDVVLVAIWAEYNKFIIADHNNDEWENLEALTDDSFTFESAVYKQYADRLVDATYNGGAQISNDDVKNSYKVARPNNTALKFYYDKECENEMEFPIAADKLVTVVYYKEIDGVFELVNDAVDFTNAIKNNLNVYLLKDIELGKYTVVDAVYTGTIEGNGYTLSGGKTTINQVHWTGESSEGNTYGGIFGALENATIKNLTINTIVTFEIGVDPDAERKTEGSDVDRECYVGIFAKSMENCTLVNVNINAEYEVTRKEIYKTWRDENNKLQGGYVENDYDVTVYVDGWQAIKSEGNNIADDCSISFTKKGEEQKPNTPDEETPGGEEGQDPSETPGGSDEGDETEGDQGEATTDEE
ncbi:MAG: hypothetical protein J1F36_00370 [Clostridiales bacterium]|nr:hypothetical protein [Clostridiales bacterium]